MIFLSVTTEERKFSLKNSIVLVLKKRRIIMNAQINNRPGTVKKIVFTMITLVFVSALMSPALAQSSAQVARELSDAFAATAKKAMPAVVSIRIKKTIETSPMETPFGYNDPFGGFGDDFLRKFFGNRLPQQQTPQKYIEQGLGSGFIISKDGYILTNNHVVGNVDKITVQLQDGRKFENAKLIGTDPDTEVALIKIEGDNFPVLPMGDSDKNEIGDWVIAIGNPFGLSETVTVGVISAVGRSNVGIAAYENFTQTDAAINPGNSGGPLINLDGQVIGINTAIYSESGGYMGIGFAIPINMARTIEEQLKEHGKVTRGYLGIYGQDVTPDMAQLLGLKSNQGIIVTTVEKGSPADKVGIESHDVFLEINSKKIESYDSFRNEVAMFKPGSKVTLLVSRAGKTSDVIVTLGERPTEVAQSNQPTGQPQSQQTMGIQVQNLTKDLADRFGYTLGEGVIVTRVIQGGPAAEAGIQPGDLIQSVNRQSVSNVDEFEQAVSRAKGNKILLLIKHGEYSQFVIVQLSE
jgi:serine protease Do